MINNCCGCVLVVNGYINCCKCYNHKQHMEKLKKKNNKLYSKWINGNKMTLKEIEILKNDIEKIKRNDVEAV